MAALIVSITVGVWESWLLESGLYRSLPHFLGLFNGAFLLIGPCLWGYARALIGRPLRGRVVAAHFTPFLLYTAWLAFVFLLKDGSYKTLIAELSLTIEYRASPVAWLKMLHLAIYGGYVLRVIGKTDEAAKAYLSSLGERDLEWLGRLAWGLLAALLLLLLAEPFAAMGYFDVRNLNNLATLALALLIFAIAAQSLSQKPLDPIPEQAAETPAYTRSGVDPDILRRFVRQITDALDERRMYTDPTLNLAELSRSARLTPQQASQAINQGLGTSFYELVNDRRVDEAQRIMRAGDGTILDAALEAGFANKATFNKAFKARCGMTPSAWRAAEAPRER